MFRRFIAIVLIVCLQSLSFASLLAVVSFNMNKEYIAAKLCENRAKPKLNCKGKCYLNKMNKKAAEQKEVNDITLKIDYYLSVVYQTIQTGYSACLKKHYLIKNNNSYCKGWPKQSFHPPGLV